MFLHHTVRSTRPQQHKCFTFRSTALQKEVFLDKKEKIAELALGYGGSIGALKKMGGEQMGLSEFEMQEIVNNWRTANPNIVQLWYDVQNAAISALIRTSDIIEIRGCKFKYSKGLSLGDTAFRS